ncbi:Cholesterol desaturase daf-36, partial [Folsomia candida]
MWKSQEKYGLIFVWYPQNEEPSWNLEEIPEIDRDNWSFRGRIVFDTLCHIQDIPENLADVPHLNEVHTDLSTISGDVRKSWIQRSHIRHIHTGEWSPSKKCDENHKAFMTMQHKIEIFQRFHCGYATMKAVHIGPALMLLYMSTPTGKFVIIQGLVPSRELRTRSILRIYAEPRMLQCFVKQLMDGIHNNALRDRVIMNRKSFTDKPFLVKEDKYIKMFRRWYAQFYGETTSNDN